MPSFFKRWRTVLRSAPCHTSVPTQRDCSICFSSIVRRPRVRPSPAAMGGGRTAATGRGQIIRRLQAVELPRSSELA
jgi:hypothetical protein